MKKSLKIALTFSAALLLCSAVLAKLPAPSDEAKAKAAEGAAKAAWTGKVEAYQLCKAQDKVAARARKAASADKDAKAAAKGGKPVAATSTCVDPGPFVYAPTAAASAAPASAAVPAKKS
jgi:hypothetical protein